MNEENTLDGLTVLTLEESNLHTLPSCHGSHTRDGLLDRYLAEIGCSPRLDADTERSLAEHYVQTGDRHAADQLIQANLRLVVKLANQYRWKWVNLLDLIQEGNTGLMIALSRFDPSRGVPFGTYAAYWIRAMILRYVSANYRMVDLGSGHYARKLFFRLNKERARLESAGIAPSTQALSEAFGVPESAVRDVDRFLRAPAVSLHVPLDGEDGSALEMLLCDHRTLTPEQEVAEDEWRNMIRMELHRFGETLHDERERLIWQQRMRNPSPASLSELGGRFGVSKQRVAQIEDRVKQRLRDALRDQQGTEMENVLCDPPGWSRHVRGTRSIDFP